MRHLATVLGVALGIAIGYALAGCASDPIPEAELAGLKADAKACLEAALARARGDAGPPP